MKPDLFKCVDLLMVAFVALAWSQVCVAQPAGKLSGTPSEKAAQKAKIAKYHNDRAACEAEARKPQTVSHPAKIKSHDSIYNTCMDQRKAK